MSFLVDLYSKQNRNKQTQSQTQDTTQKSTDSFLTRLYSKAAQNEPWTERRVLGNIYSLWDTDQDRAMKMYNDLQYLKTDPNSKYYSRYSQPTNQAVRNLQNLGFDTSVLNDDWFAQNMGWIQNNLEYRSGTGNTPSAPTKKSTLNNRKAYELYQYYIAEDRTKKAEKEYQSAIDEAKYWAGRTDRNLSDEQIIGIVKTNFDKKYSTLASMKNDDLSPLELNRAVDFSDDVLYGAIWEARNPEKSKDITIQEAMANSYLKKGNRWIENPKIAAKLDEKNEATYSPYSVGCTMDEQAQYFGVSKFDRQWLQDNRARILGGNDGLAKKYYSDVAAALDYTEKLEDELSQMNKRIDTLMKYYKDPEKIINAIKNDNAYSDLFALDASMDTPKYREDGTIELKQTAYAVDYRWRDMEAQIRKRCEKKNNATGIDGFVSDMDNSVANAPAKTEPVQPVTEAPAATPTPGAGLDVQDKIGLGLIQEPVQEISEDNLLRNAYDSEYGPGAFDHAMESKRQQIRDSVREEAKELAGQKTTVRTPELFSETEKAIDAATVNDMESIAETVDAIGTAAEKTALETGKTTLFNKAVQYIKDMSGDFVSSFKKNITDSIAANYMDNYQVIYDYENHTATRDKAQETLDEITPEWEELNNKRTASASVSGMSDDEYARLIAFGNANDNATWNIVKNELDQGPGEPDPYDDSNDRTIGYTAALEELYRIVTNSGMPTDERGHDREDAIEQAQLWYSYLKRETPIQTMIRDSNKADADSDEVEIESGNMLIRLEKGEDGRFRFAGALDTSTGNAYGADWENEVNGILGYNQITPEEEARFTELDRMKRSMETMLVDENDYLGAYEEEYKNAQMDNKFLADSYTESMKYAEDDTGTDLMRRMENLYKTSMTVVKDEYPAYNMYDVAVGSGEYTREDISRAAAQNAVSLQNDIDELTETLEYFDKIGVQMTDEQRKNIRDNLDNMRKSQKEAAYSMLDGMEDFDSVVEETANKPLWENAGLISGALAQFYRNGDEQALFQSTRLDPRGDALKRINKEETARYLYLLGKEGEEAANKYLDYLCDSDNGVLTARDMENMQAELREFAGENVLNAAIATGLSFGSNFVSAPRSIVYRIGQWLKGEDVSPVNEAYQAKNFTGAARQGSKDFLGKVVDSESVLGQLISKAYDITTGLVDYKIGSKAMSQLFEGLGVSLKALPTDNIGIRVLKSAGEVIPTTLNSAESTYQSVLMSTGDEDKAGQMAAVSFATGLLSHAVIMQGIHNSFQAHPDDVTNFVTGLFNQVLKTDMAVGISGLTTNEINALAEKAILGADSEWGKNYQKYINAGYPETVASELADRQMQEKVFNDTLNEIANATLRTAITYTAGAVKNSETAQRAFRKIETLWEDAKSKLESAGAKAKGTYTEEAEETSGLTTFGSVKNTNEDIPENLKESIPDNAIVNPVNGTKGTVMYDRTTGKEHNVVAFMTTDSGDVVFIDDTGEQIPFLKIATQKGQIADNLTDGEMQLLSYGYQYGKAQYQQNAPAPVDETAGQPDVWPGEFTQGNVGNAPIGLTEGTGTPEIEAPAAEAGQTASLPPVTAEQGTPAIGAPAAEAPAETIPAAPVQESLPVPEAPKADPNRNAKDMQTINGTYNAKTETATVGIAAVLNTGDENMDKAAAQNIVGQMAYGDTRVSAMVMQQIIANAGDDTDPNELRTDIAQAAVTGGAGRMALEAMFEKTRMGEAITADDVKALRDGIAQDRRTNPDRFRKEFENAVKENRIANRTNEIASTHRQEIEKAGKTVQTKQSNVKRAESELGEAQAVLEAASQSAARAGANIADGTQGTEALATVEQESNRAVGATTVVTQRQEQLEKANQDLTEAKAEQKSTQEKIMTEARAQATEEVEGQMAEEALAMPEGFIKYPNGPVKMPDWANKRDVAIVGITLKDDGIYYVDKDGNEIPSTNFTTYGNQGAASESASAFDDWSIAQAEQKYGPVPSITSGENIPVNAAMEAGTVPTITGDVPEEGNQNIPAAVSGTPTITEPAGAQRQFGAETAQKYDVLSKEVKSWLKDHSDRDVETNDEQVNRALSWVGSHISEDDPNGYFGSVNEIMNDDFDTMSVDGQVRMQVAMAMAAGRGDTETELKIADAYNRGRTQVARMLQAGNIFRMLSPEARAEQIVKVQDKMNAELKAKGKKYTVELPEELIEKARNATTKEEYDEVEREAKAVLDSQIQPTWGDRIIGWRMLSMLSAPKTHGRNVVGNLLFVPVVGIKNKVGAAIETAAQAAGKINKNERTKTMGFADKEARDFAAQDVNEVEDILRGNEKYKEGKGEKPIFGTKDNIISKTIGKLLQKWYDFNGKALEVEDWLFLKGHYKRALSGYMTARGLKPEDMKGKVLEEAREYAINEAQKATYRDPSAVADWMNRIHVKGKDETNSKGLAVLQWFVNARLPFKRTPINIAKRGIEYSPVGAVKSLTYDAMHLKQYLDAEKSNTKAPDTAISPTQFIDKLASGLTGSALLIAGAVAAANGIARAGFDKDDPEDQIDKLAGEQEYAIKPGKAINGIVNSVGQMIDPEFSVELLGEDVSMSLDWAAPVCLPFFTGVALKEAFEKEGLGIGDTLDILMEVTDPMLNMSFMEGVNDLFKTNSYSGKDSIWQVLEKTALNYASSMVPTWIGQVAQTIDPTRKTTYIDKNASTGDRDLDKTIQQIKNKIPWVSMGGVPYTNMFGEKPERVIPAVVENLLSPAYFSKVDTSDEFDEMRRLYKATQDKNILPSDPPNSFSVQGKTVNLTGAEYTQLKENYGELWRSTAQSLIDNPLYINASDDSKAAMWNLMDSYALQIAKQKLGKGSKAKSWAVNAYEKGNAADAIIDQVAQANKTYYVTSKAESFAEALYTNNTNDIMTFKQELEEANAGKSEVRKTLTAYFKPLYIEAYKNNDEATMYQIEDILTNINDFVTLSEPITKYTANKDFTKWIESPNTVEEEDEDENDWLNMGF